MTDSTDDKTVRVLLKGVDTEKKVGSGFACSLARLSAADPTLDASWLPTATRVTFRDGVIEPRPCPDCGGSGRAPEYGEGGLCTRCDGSGRIGVVQALAPVCATDGTPLHYVADYGAPGIGQNWECEKGHKWAKVGPAFYDPATQAHVLSPEDYR